MLSSAFYDDLADYFELIYPDWEGSMSRQGAVLAQVLGTRGPRRATEAHRVLDVAAGIGTQSLPLASLGFEVTARDVSPRAIERLGREAAARGLAIDAAPADMRDVGRTVRGPFHAVIACDNAVPHLLSDADMITAFRGFLALLVDGGVLLLSVRDYDQVDRSPVSDHPYGERTRDGRRFRLGQRWEWLDSSRYRMIFVIEEHDGMRWNEVVHTKADYYAIPIPHLLELMRQAGFSSCAVTDSSFFQPLLIGHRAGGSSLTHGV